MVSEIKEAVDGLVCTDLKVVLYGLVDSFEKRRWANMKKYANKCINREVWGVIKSIELERVDNIINMIFKKINKDVIANVEKLCETNPEMNSTNLEGLLAKIDSLEIMFNEATQGSLFRKNANRLNMLYIFAHTAYENKYLKRSNEIHI